MSVENRNLNTECYKDRDGNLVPIPISNNGLIEKMFSNAFYRGIMRIASSHWFSNLERFALSTFFSSFSITKFVRKNGINLKEYKKKKNGVVALGILFGIAAAAAIVFALLFFNVIPM